MASTDAGDVGSLVDCVGIGGAQPEDALDNGGRRQIAVIAAPVLLIMLFAVLFRSSLFGNPDVDFDEPFYLLVGQRLLHGDIVYVDIWDRKPLGLFLIYAFAAALPGNMFVNYLFVGALFAGGTGVIIWNICCRYVGRWTATLPALLYIIWQEPFNGGGGQSAIFYNLLTSLSLFLLLRTRDEDNTQRTVRYGALAMVLMGFAIQIKYTVLPEGIFFGCYCLWALRSRPLGQLALVGAAYIGLALVPTVAIGLYYVAIGHFDSFFYANFASVFDRGALVTDYVAENLAYILVAGLPLIACGLIGLMRLLGLGEHKAHRDKPLLLGWLIAATAGFFMISNFYWYYFMPLVLTFSILTAPLLRQRTTALFLLPLLTVWPLWISDTPSWSQTADRKQSIADLTAMIAPFVGSKRGCLYIFDGPSSLYLTTNSCLPTRFAYPDHLSNAVERTGLGTDAANEMRQVLRSRPGAIVTAETKVVPILNPVNAEMLKGALDSDYRLVGRRRHGWRMIRVYARRDLVVRDNQSGVPSTAGTSRRGAIWR